jgi:aspartate aminotransferase-like enzyme
MTATPHPILFIPGPTEVEPELREIMAMPLVGHRSQRFTAEVKAVTGKLRGLFLTQGTALFENVPATALMEAAIRNLVRERVLHLTCGAFGERWAKISELCGRKPESLAVEWGRANTADALRKKLRTSPPFEAVAITHSETSTAVLNPLAELAAAVREAAPQTLILVDAVTSLAGAELRFDEWGIDVAFAGTQKCLALPPGLTVWAVSERALRTAAGIPGRGFLLDFVAARDGLAKGETLATPCVPLVFALSRQLDRIAAEGLEARWRRHAELRARVLAWCARHEFEPFVEPAFASPSVTAVNASGRSVADLLAAAKAAGFTLGNGYGKLKDRTFRIGHMGDHTVERLDALLAALGAVPRA